MQSSTPRFSRPSIGAPLQYFHLYYTICGAVTSCVIGPVGSIIVDDPTSIVYDTGWIDEIMKTSIEIYSTMLLGKG